MKRLDYNTRWNVFMLRRENTLFCCVLFLSGDHMSSLQSVLHLRFRETTGQILRNCVPETRLVFVLRHPFTIHLLRDKGKFRCRKSNRIFQNLLEACSQRHCGRFRRRSSLFAAASNPPPSLATPHQPPSTMLTLSFHMGGNDTLYSATVELTNAKYNLAAP